MSNHTKGPWVIKGTLFGEWHISSKYSVGGKLLINGRQHIACSPSASSKLNPEYFSMFMANAHLIAAAPDLLEALEIILDSCEFAIDDMTGAYYLDQADAAKARAAIAKARGDK